MLITGMRIIGEARARGAAVETTPSCPRPRSLGNNRGVRQSLVAGTAAALVSLSGCGGGSASPKPTVTPSSTPAATPAPVTPTAGIVFGTGIVGRRVLGAGRTLKAPPTLAWLARLRPRPTGTSVTLTLTRTNGPGIHPLVVWRSTIPILRGSATTRGTLTVSGMKSHGIHVGGRYTMDYRQGSTVLASGGFTIASSRGGGSSGY